MQQGALLSPCGTWRYRLTRQWGTQPPVCFVGLNPSTADATHNDPTTRRCIGFAQRWGHGGLILVNLYAFRATNPQHLWAQPEARRCGPDWAKGFTEAVHAADRVVLCWGSFHGARAAHARQGQARADWVCAKLAEQHVRVEHLGMTQSGQPRHPLYRPADCLPQPWSA